MSSKNEPGVRDTEPDTKGRVSRSTLTISQLPRYFQGLFTSHVPRVCLTDCNRHDLSFSEWLAAATITDDPIGDLIDDLRRDGRRSSNFSSCADLRRFLREHRACREALRVAPAVWRRYQAWRGL
jgi:hypothetical protein